jgi:hypothetical protein
VFTQTPYYGQPFRRVKESRQPLARLPRLGAPEARPAHPGRMACPSRGASWRDESPSCACRRDGSPLARSLARSVPGQTVGRVRKRGVAFTGAMSALYGACRPDGSPLARSLARSVPGQTVGRAREGGVAFSGAMSALCGACRRDGSPPAGSLMARPVPDRAPRLRKLVTDRSVVRLIRAATVRPKLKGHQS